jgi:hypothetical protein
MRSSLAALLALSLGCSPAATPPTYTPADAGDAPDVALAAHAGSDARTDAGGLCPVATGAQLQLRCGDACVPLDNRNCGRCGNVCAEFQTCFVDTSRPAESRCGFD